MGLLCVQSAGVGVSRRNGYLTTLDPVSGKPIDPKTGKPLDDVKQVWVQDRGQGFKDFAMYDFKYNLTLVCDPEITNAAYRVLGVLMCYLEYSNDIGVRQLEVARLLGMRRQEVSRAIAILEEKGIVSEVKRVGRAKWYHMNAHYFWRCKPKTRKEMMEQAERRAEEKNGGEDGQEIISD